MKCRVQDKKIRGSSGNSDEKAGNNLIFAYERLQCGWKCQLTKHEMAHTDIEKVPL